jgi:hypothetical protein
MHGPDCLISTEDEELNESTLPTRSRGQKPTSISKSGMLVRTCSNFKRCNHNETYLGCPRKAKTPLPGQDPLSFSSLDEAQSSLRGSIYSHDSFHSPACAASTTLCVPSTCLVSRMREPRIANWIPRVASLLQPPGQQVFTMD